jgi:hypothetical protein
LLPQSFRHDEKGMLRKSDQFCASQSFSQDISNTANRSPKISLTLHKRPPWEVRWRSLERDRGATYRRRGSELRSPQPEQRWSQPLRQGASVGACEHLLLPSELSVRRGEGLRPQGTRDSLRANAFAGPDRTEGACMSPG